MSLPNRLIIVDGRIEMADGSDLQAYLSSWQINNEVINNTPVVLYTRENAESLTFYTTFALAG